MATTGGASSVVLQPFQLEGVRDTGRTVGNGSYATVKELDFRGLKCVGKKIHDVLYNLANRQDKAAMLERFASECELLSRLHHPCIVQFLGVYFERGSQLPVMVMEYLHVTLSAYLKKSALLEETSYQVLHDVVLGLRYLHEHSPPIVHRDLSANNVLLTTNMSAKISDLGVAKILSLSPTRIDQMTQTQTPGTPCYMPPEAMIARPKYTNKVDIFSFGVMILHILSGQWPIPGEAFREDPNNPESNIPLSEFDRRAEYLHGTSRDHPLVGLIPRCLNNVPSHRPEAVEIYEQIKTIMAGFTPSFLNQSEMLQRISSLSGQVERLSIAKEETALLKKELEVTREELATQKTQLRAKEQEIASQEDTLAAKESTIAQLRSQASLSLLLSPQSRLRWRRRIDMPVSMAYPHVVRINNDIYTGGGYTGGTLAYKLSRYSPAGDTWSTLSKCPTMAFGLTELNGQPVHIGGIETCTTPTSAVYTLEDSRGWSKSLPSLSSARCYLTAFHYKSFLVACGGITGWAGTTNYTRTTAVEVFSSKTTKWYNAEPLPVALSSMSHTIINDTCYLIGGETERGLTNRAFYTFLPSLIQHATAEANPTTPTATLSSSSPSNVWRELPRCPCYGSTAASLGGCLLAIGGRKSGIASKAVHLYAPSTNTWVRVSNADLPEPRYWAAATQLTSGDILLVGGNNSDDEVCNTVISGSIEC